MQWAAEHAMGAEVAHTLTPKAIEAALLWLVHEPVACLMSDALTRDALTRDDLAKRHVGKARRHDCSANGKWFADVAPDAIR